MGLFGPPNVEKMKAKKNVDGLIKALGYSKDENVRIKAVNALAEIGTTAIKPLINALKSYHPLGDNLKSTGAAEALGKIGAPAVKPLIATLGEKDMFDVTHGYFGNETREIIVNIFCKIGAPAVEPLIAALANDNWEVRTNAEEALFKIGAPAVNPLISTLKKVDVHWHNALYILGKIGAPAVGPLVSTFKEEEHGEVRQAIAIYLGDIGDPRAVEPLIAALKDKHEDVRVRAADALGKIGDKRAVEPLAASLVDGDSCRREVVWALTRLGWKPDRGKAGAWYCVISLDFEKVIAYGSLALEPLINALKGDKSKVRELAAWALGEIGDRRAVEPLIAALQDNHASVCEATARALDKIGDPRAVEPLIKILNNRDVRRNAARTLERLYRNSLIDEQTKKRILSVHSSNIAKHSDDFDCEIGHMDNKEIGIDFPL